MDPIRNFQALSVPNKILVILSQEQANATECNFNQPKQKHEQKQGEFAHIVGSHAVVNPRAMVVISVYATSTNVAMEHFVGNFGFTFSTEATIDFHQRPRGFSRSFSKQKEIDNQNNYLIDSLEHEWYHLHILFIYKVEFGQQIGWQKEQMEEYDKIDGIGVRGVLRFINYFFVALYLNFITCAIVVIQNPYQIFSLVYSGYLQTFFSIFVLGLTVCAFDQQQLNDLLFQFSRGSDKWGLIVIIPSFHLAADRQQVRNYLCVAFPASLMQNRIPIDVWLVDIVLMVRLYQVDQWLYFIVFHAHKQDIFTLCGPILHVSAALLQKLDHLQVAMQGCVHDSSIALFISRVNPSLQLITKSGGTGIESCPVMSLCELFEVLDENFHARQIILESSKMKETTIGSIEQN